MNTKLDQARDRVEIARIEIGEAEAEITTALIEEIGAELTRVESSAEHLRKLLAEVPSQAALDHSAARQGAMKEVEDIERRVQHLRNHLSKLEVGTTEGG